jgi:hypothetical protein
MSLIAHTLHGDLDAVKALIESGNYDRADLDGAIYAGSWTFKTDIVDFLRGLY